MWLEEEQNPPWARASHSLMVPEGTRPREQTLCHTLTQACVWWVCGTSRGRRADAGSCRMQEGREEHPGLLPGAVS